MEKLKQSTGHFTWAEYCCTFLFGVMPLVYSVKGVDPALLPRQGVVSVMVLFFAGWFLLRLKKSISITSLLPFLGVLLVLIYAVSVMSAVNPVESRYIVVKISVFVAFFWMMYIGFREGYFTIQSLSLGVTIGGILAAGLAIRDFLNLVAFDVDVFSGNNLYKVNATFGHKNLLSSYLFLCLPMVVIQWMYTKNNLRKAAVAIGGVIMIVVVVMLQTRAVLLAAVLCSGVAVILFLTGKILPAHQRKKGLMVLVGLVMIMFVAGYVFREKFATITRTESFIERAHVWENTWHMIAENPVTGVGAANWQLFFPKYGMQKFYEVNYMVTEGLTNFQRPHNDFLWVWAETGTLGFVAYFLFLLLGCWYAFILYRNKQELHERIVFGLFLLQLIGFIFISLVDFPLERIEHPTIVLAGIAYVASCYPSSRISMQVPKWTLMVWACVGMYSMYICNERWQSEQQLRKVYKAHTTGNWQKLVVEAQKTQTPYFNMDYFSIPVSWYIGVGYFKQNNLPKAKQYFEEAYLLHPYQVHVLNNYGACFEKEGNHTRAIELLEMANRISPSFSDGIINLSGAYYNAGRYDDAYTKISTIGYDDTNQRLKTFILAIVKKKLVITIEQNPGTVYATSLEKLLSNDAAILVCFQNARAEHIDLMEYLNNRLKDSPGYGDLK